MTPSRRFMKVSAVKRYRMNRPFPFFWNEFASMEWPACFRVPKRIFPSFFMFRVYLARLGADGVTFIGKGSVRFMNSLPRS